MSALHLPDMRLDHDEAMNVLVDLVRRAADVPALSGMLERFAWTTDAQRNPGAHNLDRAKQDELVVGAADDMIHELAAFLVHTGRLRDRAPRDDLAECLSTFADLLSDERIPDDTWGVFLDKRDMHPSLRLRALYVAREEVDT